jgi:hypothetical protein
MDRPAGGVVASTELLLAAADTKLPGQRETDEKTAPTNWVGPTA